MCLPNTWHARSVPVTLVSMMSFHTSSGKSTVGARLIFPAQLIRMSTLPHAFTVSSSRCCSVARLPTSDVSRSALRPLALDQRCRLIHLLLPSRARHHIGARLCQSHGHRQPDPRRSSHHHSSLSTQIKQRTSPSNCFLSPLSSRTLSLLKEGICFVLPTAESSPIRPAQTAPPGPASPWSYRPGTSSSTRHAPIPASPPHPASCRSAAHR